MTLHRDRLQELIGTVLASSAESDGHAWADTPEAWKKLPHLSGLDRHEAHGLVVNLFIELANQSTAWLSNYDLFGDESRDLVSSALLASAATFASFNATDAYKRPLIEEHVERIQGQVGDRMRALMPSGNPVETTPSSAP